MLKRPTQIILADARPGMTLSDPILDTKGNLLLPEGTQLTDAILESLQRHQIDSIAVAGAEISDIEVSAERALRLARVEKLFRQLPTAESLDAGPPTATEILHQYVRNFRAGTAS